MQDEQRRVISVTISGHGTEACTATGDIHRRHMSIKSTDWKDKKYQEGSQANCNSIDPDGKICKALFTIETRFVVIPE